MATILQAAGAHTQNADARRPSRRRARAIFYRDRTAKRVFTLKRVLRLLGALTVAAVVATAATFAYLYVHYSEVVDARVRLRRLRQDFTCSQGKALAEF